LVENISDHAVSLDGHQKKAALIHFHPTASNVLGSASHDGSIKMWDIEAQSQLFSYDGFPDLIQSFEFNYNGSQVLASCKDNTHRMFDPRQADAVAIFDGHSGGKQAKVFWADKNNFLGSAGFSKNNAREIKLWDIRKVDGGCVSTTDIDKQAGAFMVKFDADTGCLYLAGKGDGNIRFFEITDEAPHCFYLSEFSSNDPQKGISFLPKTICDTTQCEVMRVLRLTAKGVIVPISFCVPRKAVQFQADIFPDTPAPIPSLSADEWVKGDDKEPVLRSMDPDVKGVVAAAAAGPKKAAAAFVAKKSVADLQAELDEANKIIVDQAARIEELEAKIARGY